MIGFLSGNIAASFVRHVAAFRQGLKEAGYIEGQNVAIEYRFAEGRYDRLPELMIDLLSRRVNVILAMGNAAAQVAKQASNTPIVFSIGDDPVKVSLVASLNRPGGNITGVSFLSTALVAKSVEMLHEAVPNAGVIATLVNPTNPNAERDTREALEAARVLGLQLHVLNISSDREIDAAFATMIKWKVGAVVNTGDPFLFGRIGQLVPLLASQAMPAIDVNREFAEAGGLMSYGASIPDALRIAGVYTGRILKGEKPAELPVQQATKVELIINLKTAKVLGLTIPLSLLGRADEVIE
jgi:putative ABC transport system substrate-binding protein